MHLLQVFVAVLLVEEMLLEEVTLQNLCCCSHLSIGLCCCLLMFFLSRLWWSFCLDNSSFSVENWVFGEENQSSRSTEDTSTKSENICYVGQLLTRNSTD